MKSFKIEYFFVAIAFFFLFMPLFPTPEKLIIENTNILISELFFCQIAVIFMISAIILREIKNKNH
jgi:hypothetical protein